MAHSYTPGLRVTVRTTVRKRRVLPIPGEVLVERGQPVTAESMIARADLPGRVYTTNVVALLGIEPADIRRYMLKREGDRVEAGEPLAENRPLIPWFKTVVPSPVSGTVESISDVTGQVFLREPPRPLVLTAYLDGAVVEVIPGEGAVVEAVCSLVQGIFGIGGEAAGPIAMGVEDPRQELTPERITAAHRGAILVGGSLIGSEALARARQVGVGAIVVGGLHAVDLRWLLGRDLGVAITGTEQVGFTLIVTEGFGRIAMAGRTFDLLASRAGQRASCSGATQIRAGVIRPEVIVPLTEGATDDLRGAADRPERDRLQEAGGLKPGDQIRLIREPYFGRIGTVTALPADLHPLPTESRVRVLEVELEGRFRVLVPRANVERLES
jgi:hypothetical protein